MDQGLAPTSYHLIVSATALYTCAMVGYLAEAAFGNRGRVSRTLSAESSVPAARRPQPVGVGAVAGTAGEAVTPDAAGAPASGAPPSPEAAEDGTGAPGGPGGRPPRSLPERLGRSAVSLTVLAFALHLGGVVTRGIAAGRVPWGNMYEFTTAGTLAAVGVFLVLLARQQIRYLGGLLMVVVTLSLGLAVTVLYTDVEPLVPALRSYWLAIHVTAAMISSGIFTVCSVASAMYLVADRHDRRVQAGRSTGGVSQAVRRMAAPATLDRLAYRTAAFGFPLWTFAVIAGAIWAEAAWGRYWGWDPKETWAFITWVVYAGYLHARATAGWRGRRAALVALLGFAAFLFNLVGVNVFITGLHSYAGI